MRHGRAGFTLLELLIALSVIGMIVLVLSQALRLGYRSVDSGEEKAEYIERQRAAFMAFQSQAQGFLPISYYEDGKRKYRFKGEEDFLSFPTNYSIWKGSEGGYVAVAYRIRTEDNGTKTLYASEVPPLALQEVLAEEVKLIEGLDALEFGYFGTHPAEETGRWFALWEAEDAVPEMIRIHAVKGRREIYLPVFLRAKG